MLHCGIPKENPMTARRLFATVFVSLVSVVTATAWAEAAPTIIVELSNLRNDTGRVGCTLYNNEKGFPGEPKLALQEQWCKIDKLASTCTFAPVPAATYAVACFHDEDGDGALKTGMFGIPKEGTVVSNEAKGFMGAPKYKDSKWDYDGRGTVLHLHMAY